MALAWHYGVVASKLRGAVSVKSAQWRLLVFAVVAFLAWVNALALGLDVIAEGIEYPEQADTVFAAGCRMAQGHLFGRAVPLTELGRVLAATREEAVPRP